MLSHFGNCHDLVYYYNINRDELDIDTEFEKERSSAWYEVDFETMGTEYEYIIDAASGSILSSSAKPEHAGS